MQIPEDLVDRARRLDRPAVEAVLAAAYPAVYRIAHALVPAVGPADEVVGLVLRRSVRVMPAWRPGAAAEHWFYHHTVLAARPRAAPPGDPLRDPLVPSAGPDPAYAAFVRAVRLLPPQQAEAFVLHHGERLNPRLLAVAMDCSTAAATQHLQTATEALAAVAGGPGPLEGFAAVLSRAYAGLAPPADSVGPTVRAEVARVLRPRRLRRILKAVFWLAVLAALAYAGWRWRADLMRLFPRSTGFQPVVPVLRHSDGTPSESIRAEATIASCGVSRRSRGCIVPAAPEWLPIAATG